MYFLLLKTINNVNRKILTIKKIRLSFSLWSQTLCTSNPDSSLRKRNLIIIWWIRYNIECLDFFPYCLIFLDLLSCSWTLNLKRKSSVLFKKQNWPVFMKQWDFGKSFNMKKDVQYGVSSQLINTTQIDIFYVPSLKFVLFLILLRKDGILSALLILNQTVYILTCLIATVLSSLKLIQKNTA